MPRQAARRLAKGRVYRAPEALRGRSITLVDGGVLHTSRQTVGAYWRASARALAAVHASRLVATSVARRGGFFHVATLKRDRGRAADEPDEALKRSLREPIVGDRGLICFLNRHARR